MASTVNVAFRAALAASFLIVAALAGSGCSSTSAKPFAHTSDSVRFVDHTQALADAEPAKGDAPDSNAPRVIGEWEVEIANADKHFIAQERDEYCWAAAALTVQGIMGDDPHLTQDQMRDMFVLDLPQQHREAAFRSEVQASLAPEYHNRFGDHIVIDGFDIASDAGLPVVAGMSTNAMLDALSRGEPVVVALHGARPGVSGHVYVLYGARYRELNKPRNTLQAAGNAVVSTVQFIGSAFTAPSEPNQGHAYEFVQVMLFDPWYPKDGGGPTVKSGDEFTQTLAFAYSPSFAKAKLADDLQWLSQHDEGAGLYVRDPLLKNAKPVAHVTVSELD